MTRIAIIADDFSSATDCGIFFAKGGCATVALLDPLPDKLPQCDVVSIDTDSRMCSAQTAYWRSMRAAQTAREIGCSTVFKSIDSTLRGNLGAEIDGVMDAMRLRCAVVAPAFPHYGRTTKQGIHYLNNIPLDKSSMKDDPTHPARTASIVARLMEQSNRRIALLKQPVGSGSMIMEMNRLMATGTEMIVADAQTEEELRTLTLAAATLPQMLLVGSTGMARYLPQACQVQNRLQNVNPFTAFAGAFLTIAGSASAHTHAQIDRLLQEPNVYGLALSPVELADGSWRERLPEWLPAWKDALARQKDMMLYVERPTASASSKEEAIAYSGRICDGLCEVAKRVVEDGGIGAVFLTGGETAKTFCHKLGYYGMSLYAEVEAGVPIGLLLGENPLVGITKAGAFGSENVLHEAAGYLRKYRGE